MIKRDQTSNLENELVLDKTIGNDLEKAINKIHSGKGKKINKVREEKLYREKYSTFGEYLKNEYGVAREHGQDLAKVARFRELTGKYREEVSSMSHNSQDQFVINHNKRVKGWEIKQKYSYKFVPLLELIIGITIDSKNSEIKMKPIIINVCDKVITEFLNAENFDRSGNQTEEATKKLKENYEGLVSTCKEQLETTTISKMPKFCKHLQEVISIKKNLLTLKCGCIFRLNN